MCKLWITCFDGGRVLLYNDNHYMEYIRTTKIIRNGTSLSVVIPKEILKALKMERGDQVSFWVYDIDTIIIRRVSQADLLNLKPKEF